MYMEKIKIVNMKCEGCSSSIRKELEKQGFESVSVDLDKQEISLKGDRKKACEVLSKMGYPEEGSLDEKSFLKRGKSFVSCARGKFSNN